MSLLTFAQAKTSRLKEIAQACPDSDDFASLLNEATQALMTRGDWAGVVVPIMVCVRNGCVTWPRYVGKVRRLNNCGAEIKIGNQWWDFVNRQTYDNWGNAWGWGGSGWLGNGINGGWGHGGGGGMMTNQGRYPTFADIYPNTERLVRAYCLCQEDVGQTVQIFGVDNNQQPLRTHDTVNNVWTDGITITLAVPFGSTSVFVGRIDRVIKTVTQCNVPLYAYDPNANVLEDLANYEPSETLPNYERDRISAGGSWTGGGCGGTTGCTKSIVALVKLQFVPVVADTDLVLISNVRALKFAIQAVKLEESNQDEAAAVKMGQAVKELNLELSDEYPLDQTPVDTGFPGGIGFQKCI